LTALQFAEDHRVQFFGQALDHIYVRGLTAIRTDTNDVETSDHNPMSVTLGM
jgi:endonuclease/exonuclease/phosphatase (EEP) superfamily protein YafD